MKPVVCVDVDGVLADYSQGWKGIDNIGDPIVGKDGELGAVDFTKELAKIADVLIYTTRCTEELNHNLKAHLLKNIMRGWLDKHSFVYHEIFTGQGKPIASAFIDDKGISCRPQQEANAYSRVLSQFVQLIKR